MGKVIDGTKNIVLHVKGKKPCENCAKITKDSVGNGMSDLRKACYTQYLGDGDRFTIKEAKVYGDTFVWPCAGTRLRNI
ncbi:hypothetical protein TNCV_1323641 [Trichonephila clavipes]|nr:hypothetical protein TNCV_1323641 [Trichonephila clavipes]